MFFCYPQADRLYAYSSGSYRSSGQKQEIRGKKQEKVSAFRQTVSKQLALNPAKDGKSYVTEDVGRKIYKRGR